MAVYAWVGGWEEEENEDEDEGDGFWWISFK